MTDGNGNVVELHPTEFGLRKMAVSSSGLSVTATTANVISGFGVDIKYDDGRLYASSGRVVNPETGALVGTFSGVSSLAFVPDSGVQRVYFVTGSGASTTLQAFDLNTFVPVGSLAIPGVSGTPTSLIRWGSNGLAFRTSGNQIYFIQTSLIPPAAPQLMTDANNRVIALNSVTFVREPFSVVGSNNFATDQRTRIMIFTSNLGLTQPGPNLSVSAGGVTLSVEAVGTVAGAPDVSYIIVKLDPALSGNVSLSVTFQGQTSNTGLINISP